MAIGHGFGVGQPKTATNDPFYRQGAFQQDPSFDWSSTPVIGGPSGYLEQNQDAAYNRFLTRMGVGQASRRPYDEWLRRQFQETQLGWKSALADDPTLMYQSYLDRLGVNPGILNRQWQMLSPRNRGEYVSRFAGPMRTIADI